MLSGAEHTAGSAPITSKAALTDAITTIDDKIVIDDPLDTLNKSSTLAAAIEADAGCGTVLDFYRPATTSGLLVGDYTDSKEQKVGCTLPHTDEVTLVTSYPGGPTARWPGNDVMSAFATQTCNTAFISCSFGVAIDRSKNTMAYFSPEPGSDWNGGDRDRPPRRERRQLAPDRDAPRAVRRSPGPGLRRGRPQAPEKHDVSNNREVRYSQRSSSLPAPAIADTATANAPSMTTTTVVDEESGQGQRRHGVPHRHRRPVWDKRYAHSPLASER